MRSWMWICVLAALAAPGCAVRYSSMADSSGSSASAQVRLSSGSALGNAIIVGILVGDAIYYYRLGPEGRTAVGAPELDPDRKVNAQDCTRPVDPSAGNLMCR